jgi:hypothetical protein
MDNVLVIVVRHFVVVVCILLRMGIFRLSRAMRLISMALFRGVRTYLLSVFSQNLMRLFRLDRMNGALDGKILVAIRRPSD